MPRNQRAPITRTIAERAPPRASTIAERRLIGSYYTPDSLAGILSDWAVRGANDRVLEPSFGGGVFLEATFRTLAKRGSENPAKDLFGCDIASEAFVGLQELACDLAAEHFVRSDFLELTPASMRGAPFDVVIGNPPYIGFDALSATQKVWAKSPDHANRQVLTGRPSLWAHFIVHSAEFLRAGGRMAWVLPGSFASTKYSLALHEWLGRQFGQLTAISVSERLFLVEGAEESTVVLLADNFSASRPCERIDWFVCDSIQDLSHLISAVARCEDFQPSNGNLTISAIYRDALAELISQYRGTEIGDAYGVKIGMVTGDSSFFVRRPSSWKMLGMPPGALRHVMPRSKYVKGLSIGRAEVAAHEACDYPSLLFNPSALKSPAVKHYMATYPARKLKNNVTFAKRSAWYKPDDGLVPDLFGVFMTHHGPRVVVNNAKVNATNGYYRLYAKGRRTSRSHMEAAISICTTPAQLSAEVMGKARGAGALKIEPSNFRKLPIFSLDKMSYPSLKQAFFRLSSLMRDDRHDEAMQYADRLVFGSAENVRKRLSDLRNGLKLARLRRQMK